MEDAGMYIYYLNTDDDALEKQEYENNSEKAETVVKDMLKELKKAPESIEMKSVIPKRSQGGIIRDQRQLSGIAF